MLKLPKDTSWIRTTRRKFMQLPCRSDILDSARLKVEQVSKLGKRCLSACLALFLALLASLTFNCDNAFAADRIVLTFGSGRDTITYTDLEKFVRTGVEPAEFRTRLGINQRDIDALRLVLEQTIPVPEEFLKRLLASTVGEFVLTRLDPVIGGGTEARVEELSEALLDSIDNDQMSLLSLMKAYPEREIAVNGRLLQDAYDKISFVATDVLAVAEVVRTYMYDIVCEDSLFGSEVEQDYDIAGILKRSNYKSNLAWPTR